MLGIYVLPVWIMSTYKTYTRLLSKIICITSQYYSVPKQKSKEWMTSLLNFTKHLTVPTSILLKLIQ